VTRARDTLPAPGAEMVITRFFDAPRDLVYRLWIDPCYVSLWWGIENATNPVCEMDVRPGGIWRIHMRTPSGTVYPNQFVYLEVVENECIVYADDQDADSSKLQGQLPAGVAVHTVTFEDKDKGTLVTLRTRFATPEHRALIISRGIEKGIGQSLDRLERLLGTLAKGSVEQVDGESR
jgi:uncharacterized protein YndB with AHSA1/START domain